MVGHRLRLRALQKTLSLSKSRVRLHESESLTISISCTPCTAGFRTIFHVPGIVISGPIGTFLQLKSSVKAIEKIRGEG
jgi:hypothetical protein